MPVNIISNDRRLVARSKGVKGHGCPILDCASSLRPSNGAVNFKNPVLSVVLAVQLGIAKPRQRILEFGAGNLRNAIYLQRSLGSAHVYAYDLQATIDRFPRQYKDFRHLGGTAITDPSRLPKFDMVVCTFVVETICPAEARIEILKKIRALLRPDGHLVASFRGHGGVRGSSYHRCRSGDGFLSSHGTFIKPHSIPEVRMLLEKAGLGGITPLENYRADAPENIHLVARRVP